MHVYLFYDIEIKSRQCFLEVLAVNMIKIDAFERFYLTIGSNSVMQLF